MQTDMKIIVGLFNIHSPKNHHDNSSLTSQVLHPIAGSVRVRSEKGMSPKTLYMSLTVCKGKSQKTNSSLYSI